MPEKVSSTSGGTAYYDMVEINFNIVERVLQHVFENATRGDPESVLRAVDAISEPLMHIGEEKGLGMESVIAQNKPKILVELGGYFGYSAIRLANVARKYNSQAHYYSIEMNPVLACVIESLATYAGLGDAITVFPGTLTKNIGILRENIRKRFEETKIDFLLLDHKKELYIADQQLAFKEEFLKKGSVIVADNIVFPGAPEYKQFMETVADIYSSTLQDFSNDSILISYVN